MGWEVFVGKIAAKKRLGCSQTAFTEYFCCDKETRNNFEVCEPADITGESPRCWGEKTVRACCTPERRRVSFVCVHATGGPCVTHAIRYKSCMRMSDSPLTAVCSESADMT